MILDPVVLTMSPFLKSDVLPGYDRVADTVRDGCYLVESVSWRT